MAAESAVASTSATPLHRIRFVDYEPSPITALSFAPLPLPSPDPKAAASQAEKHWKRTEPEFGCLVVGRQNGQVDLWEYVEGEEEGLHGGWVLSKVGVSWCVLSL
jgi:U3 small nucleolar RNA-associated protein 4